MEKEVKLSHILKPIYFVVFAILLEMVNFLWLGFKVTGNAQMAQILPKYFFLDFGVIMFFAGIVFLSKRWLANVAMYLIVALQAFVNMVNATLYKVFGDIFSFDMMKLGQEAVSAFKFEFLDFAAIIVNILIIAALITLQVVLDRKLKKTVTLKRMNRFALLLVMFFACWLTAGVSYLTQTLTFYDTETSVKVAESDKYLWDNMHFKFEAYKKFGTWGFYTKSIMNMIHKKEDYDENKRSDLLKNLDVSKVKENPDALLYDDNLIVIMLESFEWFAIDPFNTPTLWEIRTQTGVSLENFHSKNKTNVSEGIGIMGNMPKDTSMVSLARNGYLNTPYTLPNLFKSRDYTANYFHSYQKTFYDRNIVNAGMGFENVYGIEDADIENKSTSFNDWNLETDYVKAMIEKLCPKDQKFMSFYTTVATHGTYDRTNERFKEHYLEYDANLANYKEWLEKNTSYVYPKNEDLEKYYRQYKCAAMDTDRMVEYLITYLRDNGMLGNTTIVMYADHNCYYEDMYFNIKGTDKTDYYDIYNYNVPCMIYSTKLENQIVNDFTNTYDIYPTICELFGLPYNKTLTQGYNVFSEDIKDTVMVSHISGIFNEHFYTLNIVDMHVSGNVSQDDLFSFKRNACRFYEKQGDIELIYKHGLAV